MERLRKLLKIAAAGMTAFAILCGLTLCYFHRPMYEASRFGNTDYNWPAGGSWLQMIEGVSKGRFDGWGFNNPRVVENPDILILGSSHMEATYVPQSQTMAQQLQELLGDEASVYNMGIAGNHLPKSLRYLPETLEAFQKPPRLIVIEAQQVAMDDHTVQAVLEGEIPSIYAPQSPLKTKILGLPYFHLLAKQKSLGLLDQLFPSRKPEPAGALEPEQPMLPADAPEGQVYDPLFAWVQQQIRDQDTEILIFYHSPEFLQSDGTVHFRRDPYTEVFKEKCREYGIGFLDLTEDFEQMYAQEHRLPHGFATGEIGMGHLNAYGHRAAAQAVFDWMKEKEEG